MYKRVARTTASFGGPKGARRRKESCILVCAVWVLPFLPTLVDSMFQLSEATKLMHKGCLGRFTIIIVPMADPVPSVPFDHTPFLLSLMHYSDTGSRTVYRAGQQEDLLSVVRCPFLSHLGLRMHVLRYVNGRP